jgi:hypothetical protein
MINPQWGFNPIIKNNKNALRSYIISTDESMDSVRWREPIIYFQKKSMHSYMKQGLGGS